MKSKIYLFILAGLLMSCNESSTKNNISKVTTTKTYDFDNKTEFNEYSKLNLDKTHPNLLNPKISEKDYQKVKKSWVELHQRIGKYLAKNNFTWEIDNPHISILHKFYFDPNGKIKTYFFRVINSNVTNKKG